MEQLGNNDFLARSKKYFDNDKILDYVHFRIKRIIFYMLHCNFGKIIMNECHTFTTIKYVKYVMKRNNVEYTYSKLET